MKVYRTKLASPVSTRVYVVGPRGTKMGVVNVGGGAGDTLILNPK